MLIALHTFIINLNINKCVLFDLEILYKLLFLKYFFKNFEEDIKNHDKIIN